MHTVLRRSLRVLTPVFFLCASLLVARVVNAYVRTPKDTSQCAAALVDSGTGEPGEGIRRRGANVFELSRVELRGSLESPAPCAMDARIVPAFKNGVAQGFKLFAIRKDSLCAKMGIQNGDVIRRINGLELNSPERVLEVYSRMKDASRIDIDIERNGMLIQQTYHVR